MKSETCFDSEKVLSSDCPSSEYRVTSDLITRQPIELELWARRHTDPPFFSEVHLNYLWRRSCGGDKSHCPLLLFHNNMEEESRAEMCFIQNVSTGRLVNAAEQRGPAGDQDDDMNVMEVLSSVLQCIDDWDHRSHRGPVMTECVTLRGRCNTHSSLQSGFRPGRFCSTLTEATVQGSVVPASPLHGFQLFSVVKWL